MYVFNYFLVKFSQEGAETQSTVQTSPEGGIRTEKCTQLLTRNIVNVNLHRCHNCYTHTALPPSEQTAAHLGSGKQNKHLHFYNQSMCRV